MKITDKAANYDTEERRRRALSGYIAAQKQLRHWSWEDIANALALLGYRISDKDLANRCRKGVISGHLLSFLVEVFDDDDFIHELKRVEKTLADTAK